MRFLLPIAWKDQTLVRRRDVPKRDKLSAPPGQRWSHSTPALFAGHSRIARQGDSGVA